MQKRIPRPLLHAKNTQRLYQIARKFDMNACKMLNLIVATALEELEAVNDPDEWTLCEPIRTEDPASTGEEGGVH